MLKCVYSLLIASLLISASASAQVFANGSLEAQTVSGNCPQVNNDDFNTDYLGATGHGVYATSTMFNAVGMGRMKIDKSGCEFGAPNLGTYYVGLTYSDGTVLPIGRDEIALRIDSALLDTSVRYLITFHTKSGGAAAPSLYLGYSADSLTFGDTITHFISPGDTILWITDTVSFKPKIAAKWISVQAANGTNGIAPTGNDYVDLDNFSIGVAPLSVGEVVKPNQVHVAPNPFHNTARLTVDANVSLPYAVAVYDMAGRIVKSQTGINNREFNISKEGLANGIYFIKVTDNNNYNYNTKLIAE